MTSAERAPFAAAIWCALYILPLNWSSAEQPLPSWNDGPAKEAILEFVQRVATDGSPDYVPPAQRIAAFDNDGCLWSEKPVYFQLLFALDRVAALAPQRPEWKGRQPFQAAIDGNLPQVASAGLEGLAELMMASHAGLTTEEFSETARAWLATARHPTLRRPYTELVFQPMLELLGYLRAHGFKTYIVSGGGVEFIRAFAEEVYGVPAEQVIGTTIKTRFEMRDGTPALIRLPEVDFIDDKEGKPIAIDRIIGQRPLAAFGNSDGDLQMLQWTYAGAGPRFCLLVRHTDATREWAYDRDSHVGRLDLALTAADREGWTVVDMKNDWKTIYPPASRR